MIPGRRWAICFVFLLAATRGVRGQAPLPPHPLTPPQIAELIAQLGDPTFARREAATKQLAAQGEAALADLRKAEAETNDPEVRRRARYVIRRAVFAACRSRSTDMELAVIDPGQFVMGSAASEGNRRPDEDSHRVRISRTFLIGTYEVTQAEFEQVMKVNPSWFATSGEGKDKVVDTDTTRFPVERVSWFDAVEFCNRLSQLDGILPYYQIGGVKREEGSISAASVVIVGGSGYRLPTEAEWEYACRAGTLTPFHFGGANTGREANLKAYTGGGGYGAPPTLIELARTARVGSYLANPAGLRDMHANVGEWCGDWYDKEYYGKSPVDDPPGPETGMHRVVRGGSWLVNEATCRCASRFWLTPGDRNNYTGFRVCRSL